MWLRLFFFFFLFEEKGLGMKWRKKDVMMEEGRVDKGVVKKGELSRRERDVTETGE